MIEGEQVTVTAKFTITPPGSRNVFTQLYFDKILENLKRDYENRVSSNIPNDSCGTEVRLNGVSIQNYGDVDLEGRANVTAHKWLCVKGSYPCWMGGLIPKTCYGVILREDDLGFTKTVDVVTLIHANILDKNNAKVTPAGEPVRRGPKFQIEGMSRVEGFSDLERFLIDLFRIMTDLVKMTSFNVIDFSEFVDQLTPHFDPFQDKTRGSLSQANFSPEYYKVILRQSGTQYTLHAESDAMAKCSIAETVRLFLVGAHKDQVGSTVHVVAEGENLWDITEREYGEPLHFRNIAHFNGIEVGAILRPGQSLNLPKLEEIYAPAYYAVRPGDTLYGISQGKPERSFEQLKGAARDAGGNPDRIYPTDIIR
ncbi:LysM peptidoglycan-binding domain-containing protein [Rhizobium leguminosarum]